MNKSSKTRISDSGLGFLPKKLRKNLMEFQKEGILFGLEKQGRCWIADEVMGLGKTLQGLSVAYHYKHEWPLLIVVPSSLKLQWVDEIEKWLIDIEPHTINVIDNGSDISGISRSLITIVTYGLLRHPSSRGVQQALSNQQFKVIILDESHYIKSRTSSTTKFLVPLIQNASRCILLSGTPALNCPQELYPQLDALCPKLFPNWSYFAKKFCDAQFKYFGRQRRWVTNGACNLEELEGVLKDGVMVRRMKKDVLHQLPDKIKQRILFRLQRSDVKKEIECALDDLKSMLFKNKMTLEQLIILSSSSSLSSVCDVGSLNQIRSAMTQLSMLTCRAKVGPVKEHIKMLCESESLKFIIFAHHRIMMDAVNDQLLDLKVPFIRIDGQLLVQNFQNNPSTKVALLSMKAAGVGLNLTAASLVVFCELDWTPGTMDQCEDRAHRIGQKSAVNIQYLIAIGSLDEWVWSVLARKTKVLSVALNGEKKLLKVARGDETVEQHLNNVEFCDVQPTNLSSQHLRPLLSTQPSSQKLLIDFFHSPISSSTPLSKFKTNKKLGDDDKNRRNDNDDDDDVARDDDDDGVARGDDVARDDDDVLIVEGSGPLEKCDVEESFGTANENKFNKSLDENFVHFKNGLLKRRYNDDDDDDDDGEVGNDDDDDDEDFVTTNKNNKSKSRFKRRKLFDDVKSSTDQSKKIKNNKNKLSNKSHVNNNNNHKLKNNNNNNKRIVTDNSNINKKAWSCVFCTYLNHYLLSSCEICGNKKCDNNNNNNNNNATNKNNNKNISSNSGNKNAACIDSNKVAGNIYNHIHKGDEDDDERVNGDDDSKGNINDDNIGKDKHNDVVSENKDDDDDCRNRQANDELHISDVADGLLEYGSTLTNRNESFNDDEDDGVCDDCMEGMADIHSFSSHDNDDEKILKLGDNSHESCSEGKVVNDDGANISSDALIDNTTYSEAGTGMFDSSVFAHHLLQISSGSSSDGSLARKQADGNDLLASTSYATNVPKTAESSTDVEFKPSANFRETDVLNKVLAEERSLSEETADIKTELKESKNRPDNFEEIVPTPLSDVLISEDDDNDEDDDYDIDHEFLMFRCSTVSNRVYIYDETGRYLKQHFEPPNIECNCYDGLSRNMRKSRHLHLIKKFVREWKSLTEMKRRVVASSGDLFISALVHYDGIKMRRKSSDKRFTRNLDVSSERTPADKNNRSAVTSLMKFFNRKSLDDGGAGVGGGGGGSFFDRTKINDIEICNVTNSNNSNYNNNDNNNNDNNNNNNNNKKKKYDTSANEGRLGMNDSTCSYVSCTGEGDDDVNDADPDHRRKASSDGTVKEGSEPSCLQCKKSVPSHLLKSSSLLSPSLLSPHEQRRLIRFCSQNCEKIFRTKNSGSYMRRQVYEAERGVCQLCSLSAQQIYLDIRNTTSMEKRAQLIQQSPYVKLDVQMKERMIRNPQEGLFWHVDHVTPVFAGGGECDIDNLRTLCTICHKKVTKEQLINKNKIKLINAAKSCKNISYFFK
ncbi:hypothetical protein HELRODRAFT_189194 [Helobdella robusta]|uniref:DNA helicase n=1 Tax=Helobdella robusta TaxID=6412 RepID=T1FQR8_HELRO|nr:hypothetical protein HELRODRAFT_189194 [Helobdella robusta]ESN96326.1 hypothetical protein HELRODRAFT_189194 [Helobdella robusta]